MNSLDNPWTYDDYIPGLGTDPVDKYGLNEDGTSKWSEEARKYALEKMRNGKKISNEAPIRSGPEGSDTSV